MRNFSSLRFPRTFSACVIVLLLWAGSGVKAQVLEKERTVTSLQKQLNWRDVNNKKGITFSEYQKAFYQDWSGRKPKKGEGYKPFKRWENYMAPRVYPSGDMSLPASTYSHFMEWKAENETTNPRARISAALSTGNWTEIGPLTKPAGYDVGVGRIDFVRFDPTNANTMYVCSPDGGLWKSIDGGTNWTTNTDFLPIIGCADLVIDPANTQTMYLATGNREFDRSSIGILKSTNGGASWTPTALAFPSSNSWTIRRLLMDPTNPLIMIAVSNVGVFRTTDGWATFSVPTLTGNNELEDAEFKPGDPSTVYAIGKDFYKSTDKGVSWNLTASGLPGSSEVSRALIAVTAADPSYVYALFGNTTGGYLGTYRSTDSGNSFAAQSTFSSLDNNILNCDTVTTKPDGQAGHNLAIIVSPTNADLVSIGGCNVWQSADGGVSWKLSSYWLGQDATNPGQGSSSADYVHADIQSLEYQPGSSTTLFVTCDGGISKSTNNGKNWTDISNNLRVSQMTSVGQSALTPDNLIVGLQDIGTLKKTGASFFVTNGGDGEDNFIDRTNDNVLITSNPNGSYALSTDAGVNRDNITGLPDGTEFFSPIAQDPVDANVVYAGGRVQLYKSTSVLSDPAAAWTALGTPAGAGGIKRFAIGTSNNQVIYAIRGNKISKSTDGGSSFTEVTGTLPVSDAQLTNVAVSNTDANKVWVTFSGYAAGKKVYTSTDGGGAWINVSTGLPNIPMNTIVYTNGSATDAVYVGADIGVYYMDNTQNWTPYMTALPNNHVNDLEIYYPGSKIRAATYGRGLWESDLFVACDKPTRVVTVTDPTCTTPGKIELTSTTGGDKYGIQNGASYAAPLYAAATAVPGSLPAIIKNNINNLADSTFTIRVFKGADNCFLDTTVTIKAAPVKPTVVLNGVPACRDAGTTYTIKFTATGGTVTASAGTVAADSVSGILIGTASVKLIITSVGGCKDSLTVVAPNCIIPCIKPDAGKDSTITCAIGGSLPTSIDLKDAQAGQKWVVGDVPAGASVSVTTPDGTVSGTTVAGTYNFFLQSQADSTHCRDTVKIVVDQCFSCLKPTFSVRETDPTCTTPGQIELLSVTNGDKYGIQVGGTYTTPPYASATPVPGSFPAVIQSNISNITPTTYTIRVFNLANDCFKDTTVTVQAALVKPTIAIKSGFPACTSDSTYTVKFSFTGGSVITVPGFTIQGDSIFNVPLTATSVKFIVTSAAGCKDSVTVNAPTCTPTGGQIALQPKAYLQGALYGVLSPNTLMRDDLRTKGFLSMTSPYPGMGMTGITPANISTAAVVGTASPSGNDAIVDWVFVELRAAADTLTVVDSRSALIQRDGDIVDVDGVSMLKFNVAAAGNYFVVVNHRNHLSVMSKNAIALSVTAASIDFRNAATPTYNIDPGSPVNVPQVTLPQGMAMWAGNVLYTNTSDSERSVIFQGVDNDVNVIYQQIINSPGNTLVTPFYKLKGYYAGDVTMDGEAISQGAGNDVEFIYQNVVNNHPGNTAKLPFFKIKEQTK